MTKLQEEFKIKVFGIIVDYVHDDLFKTDNCVKSIDEFWSWINQNYISKQQILNLECLKKEKITKNIFSITQLESRNQLRNEIKKEITKDLFKDFKQVSNPLDKDYE